MKTRNKWIKEFEDIYTYALEQPYKLEDTILLRHFLLIGVEEINFLLFKNNKPYRVNFKDETYNYFVDENESYFKKYNLYNDDGTINDEKLNNRMNYLNNLVSSLNFGNKIYLMIENIETDLYELMI